MATLHDVRDTLYTCTPYGPSNARSEQVLSFRNANTWLEREGEAWPSKTKTLADQIMSRHSLKSWTESKRQSHFFQRNVVGDTELD
jgi:hypothetical protein